MPTRLPIEKWLFPECTYNVKIKLEGHPFNHTNNFYSFTNYEIMKKIISLNALTKAGFLLSLCCLLFFGCGVDDEDFDLEVGSDYTPSFDWKDLFTRFEHENNLLVPRGGSIQEAINAAEPGDNIFIEAGYYDEDFAIDKSNLELIGLPGPGGSQVIIAESVVAQVDDARFYNITPPHNGAWEYQPLEDLETSSTTQRRSRFAKERMADGVVHYGFDIKVGSGDEEIVRLHRVVKEQRNGKTGPSRAGVFMIHGAGQDFDDIFLHPGTSDANTQSSCPVYLASNDIDVWGIDLGWTRVPAETSDFTFLQNWGVDRDIKHTLSAMSMARLIRGLTGQGFGRINLLGFSYGAFIAYGAAGKETQQQAVFKDISGLIPVDQGIKVSSDDEAIRIDACNQAVINAGLLQSGQYHNARGQGTAGLGFLALTDPDGTSPVNPSFTNAQFTLFIGANTYLTQNIPGRFWHFLGGNISQPTEIASEFIYSKQVRWNTLLAGLPPYESVRVAYDATTCICNEEEVTFDDYLDQISLPIFYLGAAGGTAAGGEYTMSLTNSNDISTHIVSMENHENRFRDFGHGDLFLADDASTIAWDPLAQWLLSHGD